MDRKMKDTQILQQHDVDALCHVLGVLHKLSREASDKQKSTSSDLQQATSLKK